MGEVSMHETLRTIEKLVSKKMGPIDVELHGSTKKEDNYYVIKSIGGTLGFEIRFGVFELQHALDNNSFDKFIDNLIKIDLNRIESKLEFEINYNQALLAEIKKLKSN